MEQAWGEAGRGIELRELDGNTGIEMVEEETMVALVKVDAVRCVEGARAWFAVTDDDIEELPV
jgi:hypothetical protein